MADRPPMSEVIEEDIEGDGSGSPSIEGDDSGSPSTIEDNKEVKEVKKKKPYVLSSLRLEALAKAREKAFSLRKEFHDNKEPTVKKEKIKKKSKLEIELENRELRASHSHLQKAVALTRPQIVEDKVDGDGSGSSPSKVVDKDGFGSPPVVGEGFGSPPVVEGEGFGSPPVVGDGSGSSPSKVGGGTPVKTRPSFVRNENGFFCI
jgi:hypothetical protein